MGTLYHSSLSLEKVAQELAGDPEVVGYGEALRRADPRP